ncbi:hypothetical protein [Croceivirga thetidis]|uniref:MFS transporter n=1 Tax=Croceivirga thetidis TaxID=2721623 RepID=A0ABX1GNX2_9FLAO|nr:hypothetical protein [Croceivirga thetidis]NKI30462.1 hypothetical protein [Croceivirga thetidis]
MIKNNQSPTPNEFVKTISIIHFGLVAGLLAFGTITFFQTDIANSSSLNQNDPLIYIAPLVGMAGIFGSKVVFQKLVERAKSANGLQDKLAAYQTASLIQWALIEGPAFLNLALFMSSGNSLYLAVAVTLLLYLAWLRPTKIKISSDLELRGDDLAQF